MLAKGLKAGLIAGAFLEGTIIYAISSICAYNRGRKDEKKSAEVDMDIRYHEGYIEGYRDGSNTEETFRKVFQTQKETEKTIDETRQLLDEVGRLMSQ